MNWIEVTNCPQNFCVSHAFGNWHQLVFFLHESVSLICLRSVKSICVASNSCRTGLWESKLTQCQDRKAGREITRIQNIPPCRDYCGLSGGYESRSGGDNVNLKRLSTARALLRRRATTDSGADTSHCGTSYFAELMLTP